MNYINTLEFAKQQDANDPLKSYREKFYFPMMHGRETIYFTGKSLGLQPKATQDYVLNELETFVSVSIIIKNFCLVSFVAIDLYLSPSDERDLII